MSKSLWSLSLNILQQLHGFVYSANDKSKIASQIYYKLTMDKKKDEEHRLDRRRASEVKVSYNDVTTVDSDTFEHILSVTSHNEALLAYYYLDGDDKVKVTEIYDVTETDSVAAQSVAERDANQRLEFDNDWSNTLMADDDELDMDAIDEDELSDRNIFSDPESEWVQRRSSSEAESEWVNENRNGNDTQWDRERVNESESEWNGLANEKRRSTSDTESDGQPEYDRDRFAYQYYRVEHTDVDADS